MKISKKKILLLTLFLSCILIIYSTINIIIWFYDNKKVENELILVEKKAKIKEKVDSKIKDHPKEENKDPYFDFMKMNYMEVDLYNLKKENSETIAWINVNNTNINYPVVKHNDNDYYLNHDFYGLKNEAGWVFMDYRNNVENFDKNTIIYAHARKNKTMFGSLKNILNSNWQKNTNNHALKLSTEYFNSIWQVFSVYKIPTTNDYIQTNFDSDELYLEFLSKIKNRSIYNFNVDINSDDKILTLSTCYTGNQKVVLHAKLIKSQKR